MPMFMTPYQRQCSISYFIQPFDLFTLMKILIGFCAIDVIRMQHMHSVSIYAAQVRCFCCSYPLHIVSAVAAAAAAAAATAAGRNLHPMCKYPSFIVLPASFSFSCSVDACTSFIHTYILKHLSYALYVRLHIDTFTSVTHIFNIIWDDAIQSIDANRIQSCTHSLCFFDINVCECLCVRASLMCNFIFRFQSVSFRKYVCVALYDQITSYDEKWQWCPLTLHRCSLSPPSAKTVHPISANRRKS